VVGLSEWLPARLAMENRPKPRVEAVVPIAADMLVPFVVLAGEQRKGPYDVDRTSAYLIDGFTKLYGAQVTKLPSWSRWSAGIAELAPHARAAFEGKENLHLYTKDIGALKTTYDAMSREAVARKLVHAAGS
jgi:hypothetical protein